MRTPSRSWSPTAVRQVVERGSDRDRHGKPARATPAYRVRRRVDRLRRHPRPRHNPADLVVVGAGVIGIEYASVFAAVGTQVTVVDRGASAARSATRDRRALQLSLRDLGVVFRLGETVEAVERHESGALIMLESGKRIVGETVLYSHS